MVQFRKIDPETGLFIEDYVGEQPVTDTGEPDPAYIATPCPDGFYWPRWNGEAWEEGGTPPAPTTPPEPTPDERMDQVEAALMELAAIIAEVM